MSDDTDEDGRVILPFTSRVEVPDLDADPAGEGPAEAATASAPAVADTPDAPGPGPDDMAPPLHLVMPGVPELGGEDTSEGAYVGPDPETPGSPSPSDALGTAMSLMTAMGVAAAQGMWHRSRQRKGHADHARAQADKARAAAQAAKKTSGGTTTSRPVRSGGSGRSGGGGLGLGGRRGSSGGSGGGRSASGGKSGGASRGSGLLGGGSGRSGRGTAGRGTAGRGTSGRGTSGGGGKGTTSAGRRGSSGGSSGGTKGSGGTRSGAAKGAGGTGGTKGTSRPSGAGRGTTGGGKGGTGPKGANGPAGAKGGTTGGTKPNGTKPGDGTTKDTPKGSAKATGPGGRPSGWKEAAAGAAGFAAGAASGFAGGTHWRRRRGSADGAAGPRPGDPSASWMPPGPDGMRPPPAAEPYRTWAEQVFPDPAAVASAERRALSAGAAAASPDADPKGETVTTVSTHQPGTQYAADDAELTVHDVIEADADMGEQITAGVDQARGAADGCDRLYARLEALHARVVELRVPGALEGMVLALMDQTTAVRASAETIAERLPIAAEAITTAGSNAEARHRPLADAVRDAGHSRPAERDYHND